MAAAEAADDPYEMTLDIQPVVQSGGKIIGSGEYGCIFQPPLLCKKGRGVAPGGLKPQARAKKLGKLTQIKDLGRELFASTIFRNNPAAKKYLVLPELQTACQPKPPSEQPEGQLTKEDCKLLRREPFNELFQYEMEHGGTVLGSAIPRVLSSLPKNFNFVRFMLQMVEIGAFMTLNGFVHNDTHSKNIVVDADYKPRLIDFGRSYSYKQIDEGLLDMMIGQYMPELGQIAPELTTIDGVVENRLLPGILEDLRTKKEDIILVERILGVSRQKQIDEFRKFWKSSRAAQQEDWVSFNRMYWPLVDSWGIGHILIGILRRIIFFSDFYQSRDWQQKQGLIKSVLRGMLRTSPRERLDCVEALALLDPMNPLVTSQPGEVWLEKKLIQRRSQRGGADAESDDDF